MSSADRRLRPIPPEKIASALPPKPSTSDAELVERLNRALAALPAAERAAAVIAFGLDAGVNGVAADLELAEEDAEALTRSALQLLRAALDDVDLDEGALFARVRRHHRTGMAGTENM